MQNLAKDIELQHARREKGERVLAETRLDVERVERETASEAAKKEELQVVVDDLQRQVQALVTELRLEKERRERAVSEAKYTSSEEEMGVSPS